MIQFPTVPQVDDEPASEPPIDYARPIVIVINGIHAKSGGGVTYLKKMLPLLVERNDIKVHLFLHASQLETFYPFSDRALVTTFKFSLNPIKSLFWEQFNLPLIARAMGADVVYSPANFGPIFARNHVSLLRNAVSVIRLTGNVKIGMYWVMIWFATTVTFFSSARVIAVSKYASRTLTYGMPRFLKTKLSIIHHGVTHGKQDEAPPERSSNLLLAVSDIYVQKNYINLIKAMAIILKKHPELELKIVGRKIDKNYTQSIEQLVQEYGLSEQVKLLGYVLHDDVMELYRKCRIFIFPSLIETFGNPLVEAMVAGAPIACSNTSAMPEIVREAGFMFDPLSPDAISDAVSKLHMSDDLRVELSRKAIERAKNFTWEKCADSTAKVLMSAARDIDRRPGKF